MKNYSCEKCQKKFNLKSDLGRHINKKIPCELKSESNNNFKCLYCQKTLASKSSLKRHERKYCIKNNAKNTLFSHNLGADAEDPAKPATYDSNSDEELSELPYEDYVKIEQKNKLKNICKDEAQISKMLQNAPNTKVLQCQYCNKTFNKKFNMLRHLNNCKIKKSKDLEKINEKSEITELRETVILLKNKLDAMENIKDELEDVKQKYNQISKTINNTTNNNNNINTTNNTLNNQTINNNINIQLRDYGKEDYSHLTKDELIRILNRGFYSVPEMINFLHFNKNVPENHNIYVSNLRDNSINVYKQGKWNKMPIKQTIDDLYEGKRDYLEEQMEELRAELNETIIKKFGRFLNDQVDDKISDKVKSDVKYLLYNNQDIPKNTEKLLIK